MNEFNARPDQAQRVKEITFLAIVSIALEVRKMMLDREWTAIAFCTQCGLIAWTKSLNSDEVGKVEQEAIKHTKKGHIVIHDISNNL